MPRKSFDSQLKPTPNGCIEWIGYTIKSNGIETHRYGRVTIRGKQILAHRHAYERAHGTIPDGLHVCHRCDNPLCCNLEHLFLGTHRDNMRDASLKQRLRGKHKMKVSDEQVEALRQRRARGETCLSIANDLGINRATVSRMARKIYRQYV